MKAFELTYLALNGFLPPLHRKIRRRLLREARAMGKRPDILDVGGRKSHYTIGVPGKITLSDLPRESDVQHSLHLGINEGMIEQTRNRRSNIATIVYDDMTRSKLPEESFDVVVAVEVLEHVAEDRLFVAGVRRVLRPGGVFIMSTPNGDFVENTNPDHKRHYRREQLRGLLAEEFDEVTVEYAIPGGTFRTWGLKSWSPRRPLTTAMSMVGNVINSVQSASPRWREQPVGTRHLIATARRAAPASQKLQAAA